MKIFLTGACGFVGSTLALQLRAAYPDLEIIGLDNLARAGSWLNREKLLQAGVTVRHGDIRLASDLEGLPACDWVIDGAAVPTVMAGVDGRTSSRQLVEHNLLGTLHLLEYCKNHRAGFILLSTSRVFSIPPLAGLRMTLAEQADHPTRWRQAPAFAPDPGQDFPMGISPRGVAETASTEPPVSLYGSTKVCSEHLALEYGETFGFPVWINRCGVMSGAGQFGHPAQGIFAYWIHACRERRPLRFIGFGGQGAQVRDVFHPRDLAPVLRRQMLEAHPSRKPRVCHFGGGPDQSCSLAQLHAWCSERYSGLPPVQAQPETRPFDIPWMVFDGTRAREVWHWQPTGGLEPLFQEIAAFADAHPGFLQLSAS